MSTQCSVRWSFAGAVALALFGMAPAGAAQTPPPPPPPQQPMPPTTTTMPVQPAQSMPAQPQTAPPQQPMQSRQPMPAQQQDETQQSAAGQFYQGTATSARYPLPDSNGGTLTVNAGMPDQVRQYGPPPPFATLDSNHDGRISESEAQAYPPLDSDFLYASGEARTISRAQYEKWVQTQH